MRERRASRRRSTTCRCTARTAGRRFSARPTECPVTDDISGRLMRLPFYNNLTRAPRASASSTASSLCCPQRAWRDAPGTADDFGGQRFAPRPGPHRSSSPDYWWYRARAQLLEVALGDYLGSPRAAARRRQRGRAERGVDARRPPAFTIDVDPRGLKPGEGVCASALALPFGDATFDVVGAFDVLEHCEPESQAVTELVRVLAARRAAADVGAGLPVGLDRPRRAGGPLPPVHAQAVWCARSRAAGWWSTGRRTASAGCSRFSRPSGSKRRLSKPAPVSEKQLPRVPAGMDRVLMGLTRAEAKVLRRSDLPFGSSVFLAATKPMRSAD